MRIEISKILERYGGDYVVKIRRLIENRIEKIHTTTIGVIESFDSDKQIAVIQPAIKRVIQTEKQDTVVYETEKYPLLVNVPVIFPGGGDWFLTFPIKKGDECLIFSMERSIGFWKKNGGVQDPSNYKRKLSFKDAIAMVGLNSQASSLPSFNDSEPEFRNRDGSVKLTMTNSGMTLEGDLQVTGEVTAKSATTPVGLSTHVHTTTATIGASATPGVISSPTPGT